MGISGRLVGLTTGHGCRGKLEGSLGHHSAKVLSIILRSLYLIINNLLLVCVSDAVIALGHGRFADGLSSNGFT